MPGKPRQRPEETEAHNRADEVQEHVIVPPKAQGEGPDGTPGGAYSQ
jgi:hypothetical protein